jgi:hypothetical protein
MRFYHEVFGPNSLVETFVRTSHLCKFKDPDPPIDYIKIVVSDLLHPEKNPFVLYRNDEQGWDFRMDALTQWKYPHIDSADDLAEARKEDEREPPPCNLNQKIIEAVHAKHHKCYIENMQWVDAMCRIPRYRNSPEEFVGAIELQVRKYLDRIGRKDDDLQEYLKARWYLNYLCAYVAAGCVPIMAEDADKILANYELQKKSV